MRWRAPATGDGALVAEAAEEAGEDPDLRWQRSALRRRRGRAAGDRLVVVGVPDGLDDLLLGEVLRALARGHEADEHAVGHDLRLEPGGAVGVPHGLTPAGHGHDDAELVDAGLADLGRH